MPAKSKRKKRLEAHIRNVESGIADVDQKISEAEGDLQTYYREALVKLKEVKNLADTQLERLHESGEETWDELRDEVDEAIERVRTNLDALMARFRDETSEKPPVRRKAAGPKSRTRTSASATKGGSAARKAKSKATRPVTDKR